MPPKNLSIKVCFILQISDLKKNKCDRLCLWLHYHQQLHISHWKAIHLSLSAAGMDHIYFGGQGDGH